MQSKRPLLSLTALSAGIGFLIITTPLFAASKVKVLHSFGNRNDGIGPYGSLVFDNVGNLYGTTAFGGSYSCGYNNGCGTVFQLTPDRYGTWKEKTLHDFTGGGDGCTPFANLIFDTAGNLYGTASGYGGVDGPCRNGNVFELSPGANAIWTFKVLHSFGVYDSPNSGLIFDAAGNLYGTTGGGGGYGSVFELLPGGDGTWTEKDLYFFMDNGKDGIFPAGGLIFDAKGNLYGMTCCGGAYGSSCSPNGFGCGTVFELTPGNNGKWKEKVLRNFNYKDGANAAGGLISDAAGNLYGTTAWGGAFQCGVVRCGNVFELSPAANGRWTEKTLHSFNGSDGSSPNGSLIFDAAGNLYGTTLFGGAHGSSCHNNYNCGTVFELEPGPNGKWTEKVLLKFNGGDGEFPGSGLIFDSAGNLYGTTEGASGASDCGYYGAGACGGVFEITP